MQAIGGKRARLPGATVDRNASTATRRTGRISLRLAPSFALPIDLPSVKSALSRCLAPASGLKRSGLNFPSMSRGGWFFGSPAPEGSRSGTQTEIEVRNVFVSRVSDAVVRSARDTGAVDVVVEPLLLTV